MYVSVPGSHSLPRAEAKPQDACTLARQTFYHRAISLNPSPATFKNKEGQSALLAPAVFRRPLDENSQDDRVVDLGAAC